MHFYLSWLVKNLSHFLNQSGARRNWSSLVPTRFPRLPLRTTGFELWLVHFDVCMLLLCRPKIVLIKVRISCKRGKVRKEMFKSVLLQYSSHLLKHLSRYALPNVDSRFTIFKNTRITTLGRFKNWLIEKAWHAKNLSDSLCLKNELIKKQNDVSGR